VKQSMRKLFAISLPGAASWFLGVYASVLASIPLAVQTYMLLAVADWIVGAVNAGLRGVFCIRESVEGLWRKVMTLILIGVAHHIMTPLHLPLDVPNTIAVAFVINEAISIVLNMADAGLPIPPALVEILAQMRKYTGRGKSGKQVRAEIDGQGQSSEDVA